ncbi:MAG: T9SS type A sorting domain-containing protein [Bacteroidota bacterium]|nr:T9SS type A sorting domain-containing protein [Bacteroidota bacterium]
MRRTLTYTYSWIIPIAFAICISYAPSESAAKPDTTYLHLLKSKPAKSSFKSGLHLVLPPLRPAFISTTKVNIVRPDDKLLNNVQIYPNPVTDQINLKYDLSRNANVTIKIMDVLGNDIITLFSQRVDPGERNFSYALNSKLTRGFYFVRVVAGTESIIKRISVL